MPQTSPSPDPRGEELQQLRLRIAELEAQLAAQPQAAEQTMRQHEALLQLALETANMATWSRDVRTNQQLISFNLNRLAGFPDGHPPLTLQDLLAVSHPEDRERLAAMASEMIEQHTSYHIEHRIIRQDGEVRWLELRGHHHFDESGAPVLRVGVAMDITERKQAEAEIRELNQALEHQNRSLEQEVARRTTDLQEANRELARAARTKDEFLATMSHELRSPLTSVLGVTELLLLESYGPLSERQRHAIGRLERSGQHLLALINDVLDLAKIEAGKLTIHPARLSVEQISRSCVENIRPTAAARDLTVELDIRSPGLTIEADELRLRQILINLLSNAVKFTPEGRAIGLEIVQDESSDQVRFTVWDTGIGIAPEDHPRLFQPFVQLDAGLARAYDGTGLGLALVGRLVKLHGGAVSVESEPGVGSRFTVSLPRRSPSHAGA